MPAIFCSCALRGLRFLTAPAGVDDAVGRLGAGQSDHAVAGCLWPPENRGSLHGASVSLTGVSCSWLQLGHLTAQKVSARAGATRQGRGASNCARGGSRWRSRPSGVHRRRRMVMEGPRNGHRRELASQGSGRQSWHTWRGWYAVQDGGEGPSPRQACKSQLEAIRLATNLRDPNRRSSMKLSVAGDSDTETEGIATMFPSVTPQTAHDL
ncbi:hypothetical protein NDU88_002167 [Pleurodeles waltl]|uniref:Uncharacterized protein n=1 Tax=Pleurodeles waltl TaxID=8319 RepID=A0AAV7NH81_PLEWA|nr:hypothetical protein NDU88_002167 [Pleurodeles waltl]